MWRRCELRLRWWSYCNTEVYQISTLCTLSIRSVMCQLYLNKLGAGKKSRDGDLVQLSLRPCDSLGFPVCKIRGLETMFFSKLKSLDMHPIKGCKFGCLQCPESKDKWTKKTMCETTGSGGDCGESPLGLTSWCHLGRNVSLCLHTFQFFRRHQMLYEDFLLLMMASNFLK